MQNDIRLQYQEALSESHYGRPTVMEHIHTGEPGRPRIQIDPDFLRWAYGHRSTSGIARFLGVARSVVQNALIEHGIAQPQQNPFPSAPSPQPEPQHNSPLEAPPNELNSLEPHDDILDPHLPIPNHLSSGLNTDISQSSEAENTIQPVSFTGPLSNMTDDELDDIVICLQSHYHRAGISMLDRMLRRLGHHVPQERVRLSLICIDPVQRVFSRICIRRRVYSVPGPNSLWHHDGQHGKLLQCGPTSTYY